MAAAKHTISIYTMMMILAAIFMFLACVFMGIEWARYEGTPSSARIENSNPVSNWS
ncbi:MAG TPA: hypothetical protein VM260_04925 [Pirellula sp.]|nr:hypothetical protein [Pirellula sp.]